MLRIVARQLARQRGATQALDDLQSAGLIGLLDAFNRFEPGRHVLFKTYAEWRVRGAMMDELRAQDWTPRGVRSRQRSVDKVRQKLEAKLQRRASDQELQGALGLDASDFGKLVADSQPLNVVRIQDYRRLPQEEEDPGEAAAARQRREAILKATQHLTERQREVILAVYYEGLSNAETSRKLKISESRVCQIHQEALASLRRRDDLRLLLGQLFRDLAA